MDFDTVVATILIGGFSTLLTTKVYEKVDKHQNEKRKQDRIKTNYSLIESGDLNSIKQIIGKEIFFKAFVFILESSKDETNDRRLQVFDFYGGKTFKWIDREANRTYLLSLEDGLSHKRYNQKYDYVRGEKIPLDFKDKAEELFWKDAYSYLENLLESRQEAAAAKKMAKAEQAFFASVEN